MSMDRRERLLATLRGECVDRPPVSFYEINGLDEHPEDSRPYNIYAHPSWLPVIDLAREYTDRIVMRTVPWRARMPDPLHELSQVETWEQGASRFERLSLRAGKRVLTALTRRDLDVNTVWQVEHLLKDAEDLRAYLDLPCPGWEGEPDPTPVLEAEAALAGSGIVMLDTPDPLCQAAALFHMQDYTILATREPGLFTALLERFASTLLPRTEVIAKALPGRLWRIYGPEYASPPYLHPRWFHEYVVRYDTSMVQSIQRYGGYARLHSHGNLRRILDEIASTGCDALDPIEPPPQGDVELREVRERHGQQMVLFGNLEASDLENLPTAQFEKKIRRAIDEGTAGQGRGFVLMPSSCPYGRVLPDLARANYEKMVEVVHSL
jgi:hypothetical protein